MKGNLFKDIIFKCFQKQICLPGLLRLCSLPAWLPCDPSTAGRSRKKAFSAPLYCFTCSSDWATDWPAANLLSAVSRLPLWEVLHQHTLAAILRVFPTLQVLRSARALLEDGVQGESSSCGGLFPELTVVWACALLPDLPSLLLPAWCTRTALCPNRSLPTLPVFRKAPCGLTPRESLSWQALSLYRLHIAPDSP